MNCKIAKTNSPAATLRRVITLGSLTVTALLAAALPHAGAQTPSPLASSPTVQTPFSWPNFHTGGPLVPHVLATATGDPSALPYTLPDDNPFPNPLGWQLNGTPTGLNGNTATEIPSFLLGNFNPTQGPSGTVGTFFRNNFRDGSFYQVAAPFPFLFPALSATPPIVDDTNFAPNNFTDTTTGAAWQSVDSTNDATGGTLATNTYTTATNQEYLIHPIVAQDAVATATAQWTVALPTASPAGFYTVTVHLPNSPAAAAGSTINPFQFNQDAHYIVELNPTQTTNPTAPGFNKVADVRIQQGILNDQPLAGPFLLQPNDQLVVTLDNTTKLDQSASTVPIVVAADSISLQQNTGGDVESAPAAVNATEYPEIANAEYYGLAAGTNSLAAPVTTAPAADANPRGNQTVNATPFTAANNTPFDTNHAIRQLVYFGRLETVPETVTDSNGTHAVRVPVTSTTGPILTQQVGAVYCMDGFTGAVVWRYQTPGSYSGVGVQNSASGPVFSSPALARINVLAAPGTTTPYATKLVVVIADNRGFVYCLDAVGSRDGTSNSTAVYQSTDNTLPTYVTPTSGLAGLPILSPGIDPTGKPIYAGYTGLGDFGTTTADPPHEGNTTAYWVYRPDPARPKTASGNNAGKVKTTLDPASDLPVPAAFGLASPTVYTKGYVGTASANTTGATETDYPGATGVAALTSNSVVYIGNGNGVLYALDGLGYPVAPDSTTGTYLTSGTVLTPTAGDRFNATLNIENKVVATGTTATFLPTPAPLWWFSIRGPVYETANTSTATIESAPAVFVSPNGSAAATGTNQNVNVTVYVTSAHESSSVPSSGRLYAIDGINGPSGNGGKDNPVTNGSLIAVPYQGPGSFDYNVDQRPKLPTDTSAPILHWSFPDAYGTGQSSNKKARLPLGNITGSPVVFANTKQAKTFGALPGTFPTVNIYIAANSGPEVAYDLTTGNQLAAVPDDNTSGRLWKVNLDGSTQWAYPDANDPNSATLQNTAEPSPPMGAFLHATPAIGYVQFPTTIVDGDGMTAYTHSDQSNADIKGQTVPMLYVATSGYDDALLGPGFYAIDIDTDTLFGGGAYPPYSPTSTNDADSVREIEAIPSPTGETFVSSPVLVVNPSATGAATPPGNGGAIFVVGSNNTFFQFGATPITNSFADGTTQPYFPVDKQITGLGPISAPAVAGASVTGFVNTVTTTTVGANVDQDWVYVGSSDGLCFGITPAGLSAGGFDPGQAGPPNGPGNGAGLINGVSNQFQLHSYITTSTTKKDFTASDIPNPATSTVPPFEWGENVNIRVTNVVPPKKAGQLEATSYKVYDDQTGDYYDNGQAVTFSVTATSPTGGAGATTPATIPATVLTPLPGTLPGNGFVIGTDTNIQYNASTAGNVNGKLTTTQSGGVTPSATPPTPISSDGSSVWVAATTFPVRNEEPGAQHRIISVTQIADHYKFTAATSSTPAGYTYVGSVTLQSTLGQGTQFENPNVPGTFARIGAVTQPLFAVLNPLAVRGAGIPIAFTAAKPAEPIGNFTSTATDGLGPFRGLVSTGGASPVRLLTNTFDLQALTNGNRVYTTTAPPASVSGTINAGGGRRRRNRQNGYPQRLVRVTTSTGLINHNSTGSNADPNATTAVTLLGNVTQNTDNGLTPVPAYPYGQYTLDVADRSALGLAGLSIGTLRMERNALGWNDNTGLFGNNATNGPTNGVGAVINPLPWDDTPVTGSNHSRDYPDIRASATADILNNTDLTTGSGTPDPAQVRTDIDHRNVVADPVKVQVSVPRYQPANLMFFDTANGPITPDNVTPAITNSTFPMGYINTVRVFVDTNKNGRLDPGEAYRSVQVFSGVPVDMTTSIDTPTTDLGKLPQGFGLQTDAFAPLGTFMPYPTATQINGNGGAYLGNLQNPGYVSFFKPMTISNRGNTNLFNVHLDQKIDRANPPTAVSTTALPLVGDTLDAASQLPAYDINGALTGPRNPLPGGTPALPFLIRSSLDDDLVAAFGHNPGFVAVGAPYTSLGATFHKSRVGDSNPVILTVPDVPRDNDPTNAGNGYNLAVVSGHPPVATQIGLQTSATGGLRAASIPYVALAIPQGTPVGTYATRLQLFEGVDPSGYKDIYNGGAANTGPYVPILPPQYGTQTINPATATAAPTFAAYPGSVASDLYGYLVDTLIAPNNVPSVPYSNGTVIKASVTEARLTDGFSRGDLPQIDAQGAVLSVSSILPSADFLPSAFRDPNTGNVSLYWTSARLGNPAYSLNGRNLSFQGGYFSQNGSTAFQGNSAPAWWSAITPTATLPTGINSAISVVPTGNYAFVQNVSGGTAGAPVSNNLLCYQVTPGTGALMGTPVPVTANTSQPAVGARGLSFSGVTFSDAFAYPANPLTTSNNLWGFWYGGARGRSAIYYSSATSASVNAYTGPPTPFVTPAVLPIPAGLVSVSDPTAVLTTAPDASGAAVPVLEVTYTGIAPDGNADIYVSRYRPYIVRKADNVTAATDANGNNIVALALLPPPPINEQLQATGGSLYYQARDVAWARNDMVNLIIGNTSVLQNLTGTKNADGSYPLYTNIKTTFDRQTGSLVYTGSGIPNFTFNAQTYTVNAIYVDLARGRVRFSFSPQLPAAVNITAFATFTPQARRITTDTRADTAPVAFIDTTLKTNEAGFNNVANQKAGIATIPDVEADRYWFIWRKSGAPGASTTPTLYYKTQRLTVDLQLRDANGQPIGVKLDANGKPLINVTLSSTGDLYAQASGGVTDVDWVRGRVYFPRLFGSKALEGQTVTITGTDRNGNAIGGTNGIVDTVHWLDEPRFNANSSSTVAPLPTGSPITTTALTAAATGDTAVPIDTVTNESNVTAFLDPFASPTSPHKVWLFWNSTRNGTADIYYETISPLFSATVSP